MAVTIDSISPNAVCIEEYKKEDSTPSHLKPKVCEMTVVFNLPDKAAAYSLRFIKQGIKFGLSGNNDGATVALLIQSGLNLEDQNLQALLLQSIPLSWIWKNNYKEGYLRKEANPPIQNVDHLFQLFSDFLSVGSFEESGSKKQRENLTSIFDRLVHLNPSEKVFIQKNLTLQLEEDVARRLFSEVVDRMQVLNASVDWMIELNKSLDALLQNPAQAQKIFELEKQILSYLFISQPNFEDLKPALREVAILSAKNKLNFYENLTKNLEVLSGLKVLQKSPSFQTRYALLNQWLQQAARSEELRYGVLPEKEAFELSFLDQVNDAEHYPLLASNVSDLLGPPQLTPEWFASNGNLPEIIHAIFQNVELQEDKDGKLVLKESTLNTLGFNLTQVLSGHGIQDREFAAGILAVLIYSFGQSPASEVQWRVFWKGEVRSIKVQLSADNIETLNSNYRFLKLRIKASLQNTEQVLPWAEAGLCVGGLAVLGWGIARSRENLDPIDPVLLTGSGLAGFGCGAGATHYLLPTRNAYISDSIGGGILAVVGVGVPLLLNWLSPKESNPAYTPTPTRPDQTTPVTDYHL